MEKSGVPILAFAGQAASLQDRRARAKAFGGAQIEVISALPVDARHRSKMGRVKLAEVLQDQPASRGFYPLFS